MKFNAFDWIAFLLIIVGALNWGLVGAFDYNLVAGLFGDGTALERTIYVLVGAAGIYSVYGLMKPYMDEPTTTSHHPSSVH